MHYIGIDLAWGQKNTSGVAVLKAVSDDPARGATLTHAADDLLTDDDLMNFVAAHDDQGGLLIAVDAPTLVPNETGRRPCEAILSTCLRRVEAGPHPANRARLAATDGTVRGEHLVSLLAARGIQHTPYIDTLAAPVRAVFEVYPHPAHVALFSLSKTLKYKLKPGRDLEARAKEFRRYITFLEGLRQADPPLLLPEGDSLWLRRDPANLKPTALKRHEDALDALTCAYVALYRQRWGDERCPVVGDLQAGYIVTPANEDMKACFLAQAETPTAATSVVDTKGGTT